MFRRKLVTSLVLCGVPLLTAACSQADFDDCSATRTCSNGGSAGGSPAGSSDASSSTGGGGAGAESAGTAGGSSPGSAGSPAGADHAGTGGTGSAGEGGAASDVSPTDLGGAGDGAAGAAGSADCATDDDCGDGFHCNGNETCQDGSCRSGEPFACGNQDTEHCSVRCEEGPTEPRCVVEALDRDRDGFGTALCAAAPGPDCDDGDPAIHPDAEETCDGLDNDCDGLVDTNDGLPLAGTMPAPIGEVLSLDLSWSPESGTFGAVYDKSTEEGVFFGTLSTNNVWIARGTPTILPLQSVDYGTPHLAWGDGSFGVAWSSKLPIGDSVVAAEVTADGAVVTPASARPNRDGAANDIAARSDGLFVLLSNDSGDLRSTRFDGTVREAGPHVASNAESPRLATRGDEAGVVWHDATNGAVYFRRLAADLVPVGGPVTIAEGGAFAEITSTSAGYAVAWIAGDGRLGFARLRGDGRATCTTTFVELGAGVDGSERVAVADTQYGTLALFTRDADWVRLFRFDADCGLTAALPVAEMGTAGSPVVATGGGKVAIAWTDRQLSHAYARVVGELLCE